MSDMPEAGDKAPPFEGQVHGGGTVSLDDYKGKKLALYFYPTDDTPGCTKQACNLRDNFAALGQEGIAILGVSKDSVTSHERFADKYSLPFPLIADEEKAIMGDYGVWGEKKLYGRVSIGTKRTTFLIGEDGTIKKVIKRPKTKDHAAEIIRGFNE